MRISEQSKSAVVLRMLELAGLTEDDVGRGQSSRGFLDILDAFEAVNRGKAHHYGDYIENMTRDTPPLLTTTQLYSEVKRKWFRFDNLIKRISSGEKVENDQLIEALGDLGVYSAMGIGLILHQENAIKKETQEA